jgi:hypothetical protein
MKSRSSFRGYRSFGTSSANYYANEERRIAAARSAFQARQASHNPNAPQPKLLGNSLSADGLSPKAEASKS